MCSRNLQKSTLKKKVDSLEQQSRGKIRHYERSKRKRNVNSLKKDFSSDCCSGGSWQLAGFVCNYRKKTWNSSALWYDSFSFQSNRRKQAELRRGQSMTEVIIRVKTKTYLDSIHQGRISTPSQCETQTIQGRIWSYKKEKKNTLFLDLIENAITSQYCCHVIWVISALQNSHWCNVMNAREGKVH